MARLTQRQRIFVDVCSAASSRLRRRVEPVTAIAGTLRTGPHDRGNLLRQNQDGLDRESGEQARQKKDGNPFLVDDARQRLIEELDRVAARKITSACDRIDGSRQNPVLSTGPARERDGEKAKELVFLAERQVPEASNRAVPQSTHFGGQAPDTAARHVALTLALGALSPTPAARQQPAARERLVPRRYAG